MDKFRKSKDDSYVVYLCFCVLLSSNIKHIIFLNYFLTIYWTQIFALTPLHIDSVFLSGTYCFETSAFPLWLWFDPSKTCTIHAKYGKAKPNNNFSFFCYFFKEKRRSTNYPYFTQAITSSALKKLYIYSSKNMCFQWHSFKYLKYFFFETK